MKLSRNQSGFSVVELLLILVVVGIVGFTGWFVWHSKQATDKASAPISDSIAKASTKIDSFEKCKAASGSKILETYPEQCVTKDGKKFTDTNQEFLVIKEWNVKIPLTAALKGLSYEMATASADGSKYVQFQMKSLAGACGDDIAHLVRVNEDPRDPKLLIPHPEAKQIGNYYYFGGYPQAACTDDDVLQAKASATRKPIGDAIQAVQPL